MAEGLITIMGATGNTGAKIAKRLLAAGAKVRALGRSSQKLAPLARAGAEVVQGDLVDPAFLTRAFEGSEAVYTLLPTDRRSPDYRMEQDRQGEAIVQAVRAGGVPHVVALSSVGADLDRGTGLIIGLHAQEERLRQLDGASVLLIRPVSFFENFHEALPLIREQGIVADAIARDLAIPMIATRDIAEVAARALQARDWRGVVVRELLGPRDLTYAEATRLIGQRLGKPDLPYVQLSYEDMAGALMQGGLSESFAILYTEMARAINDGTLNSREGRNPQNATPTPFEAFADELARTYEGVEGP